jgi:hypothetical protein
MFETKDKKQKFGSAYKARRYDSAHEAPEHEAKETPEFEAGEQEGKKEAQPEQHPVVAQHGPAHTVHIKHDHTANKHHVHSTHEDGHENMSEHQSAAEAHEEGGKLANVSPKTSGEAGPQQGAQSEEMGYEMPPLV